jgi:hypothetical protein
MAVESAETSLKEAIVEKLRDMAANRQTVEAMVEFLRTELPWSEVAIIPVMAYFCRAFSLPLRVVLPLREWVESHDDGSIAELSNQIQEYGSRQVSTKSQSQAYRG